MNTKETLRQWLAKGENKRVIDMLQKVADESGDRSFTNKVTYQAGRFSNLQKDQLDGVLDGQLYQREVNLIRRALQELIEDIPNVKPKHSESRGNAIEIDYSTEEKATVRFDPTPARATKPPLVENDLPSTDPSLEEIKNSCIRSIEINLRKMANHYFDENGFERPSAPDVFYVQSYLTLQGMRLRAIEESLRAVSPGNHDFFQPVKTLSRELKAHCDQLNTLLEKSSCEDFPLRTSLQKTVLCLELLEETLPDLITDRKTETREALKSNYLIPLADQTRRLSEKMASFDGKQIKAENN